MRSPVGITVRNDEMGSGYFGTPRTRGKKRHTHTGVDIIVSPGEQIFAPEDCTVERLGICYGSDPEFHLIAVSSLSFKHRILYIKPCVIAGARLKEGDPIGHAQNIQDRHGDKMIPHIHWDILVGSLLDSHIPANENIITYVWINPMNLLGLR